MARRRFNPKRRISDVVTPACLASLAARVSYTGNPEHKERPGDFGLTPPVKPRPDKSKCDRIGILKQSVALRLLREGVVRGLVSRQVRGGFPQNIRAVTDDGDPVETQLENQTLGTYRGYTMPETDPLSEVILRLWCQHEWHI